MSSQRTQRIFIAGHNGMVGSAIKRKLEESSDAEILVRSRDSLDLLDQRAVFSFFKEEKIDVVYLAAAKVGGIHANDTYPADFIYQNLTMQCNIIEGAHRADVQDLLFLGSSCIYPKLAEQPMNEDSLLSGKLEPTNEPYAIAKIAGIKMCESYNRQFSRNYRSVMPTNLYGIGDNFHPLNSHVIPSLIRRFHEAIVNENGNVEIWGSGKAKREFLHVDDLADACVHIMDIECDVYKSVCSETQSHINIGTGKDCSIQQLAEMIKKVSSYTGEISYDVTKPDGAPRKLLDVSLLSSLGWQSGIELESGLLNTWKWFSKNFNVTRSA